METLIQVNTELTIFIPAIRTHCEKDNMNNRYYHVWIKKHTACQKSNFWKLNSNISGYIAGKGVFDSFVFTRQQVEPGKSGRC